jgi:glyoxylase-like metal-dependent hydrolase (beta-lactamase superfamily II)
MDEADTYNHAERQMQMFLHKSFPLQIPPVEHYLQDGDCISFGNHSLRVISTPGHTPGGVCYYIESESLLLSGDSLFQGSIGRCDLPGGNEASLINNLRNKILTLPGNTKVLPGHGPSTTIDEEIRTNPFF